MCLLWHQLAVGLYYNCCITLLHIPYVASSCFFDILLHAEFFLQGVGNGCCSSCGIIPIYSFTGRLINLISYVVMLQVRFASESIIASATAVWHATAIETVCNIFVVAECAKLAT